LKVSSSNFFETVNSAFCNVCESVVSGVAADDEVRTWNWAFTSGPDGPAGWAEELWLINSANSAKTAEWSGFIPRPVTCGMEASLQTRRVGSSITAKGGNVRLQIELAIVLHTCYFISRHAILACFVKFDEQVLLCGVYS